VLTRSASHLAFGKDDVSCLDMPTRHTRTSRGIEAPALLRGGGRDGNVSRAALKLHVSQPALSRQIRDLEDELGVQLFERAGKAVNLTDAGRLFLKEACTVLERTDEAVRKTLRLTLRSLR